LARARIDHADMLQRRGAPDARLEELVRPALATCAELSMAVWQSRGERLLARSGLGPEAAQPSPASTPAPPNLFRLDGDFWTVSYAGTTVRLKDVKGLHYLSVLLHEPGRDFHVADLAGAPLRFDGRDTTAAYTDTKARDSYRRQIAALREELTASETDNDVLRAARIRDEIERLGEELASAYWRGATAASSHDPAAQNLRKAVAKNIRSALTRIQAAHEPLWRHLYTAVRTGILCSYRPDRTVDWQVRRDRSR
jgi:hypothetical protein